MRTAPSTTWKEIVCRSAAGQTIQQLCAAAGLECPRGSGFYELQKTEKVSAAKELVLKDLRTGAFLEPAAAVRAALGLGTGDVSISPAAIPDDKTLFVQSTSTTRKVADGSTVLVRLSGASPGTLESPAARSSAHGAAPATAKHPRRRTQGTALSRQEQAGMEAAVAAAEGHGVSKARLLELLVADQAPAAQVACDDDQPPAAKRARKDKRSAGTGGGEGHQVQASLDWAQAPHVVWECGGLIIHAGLQPPGWCDSELSSPECNPDPVTPETFEAFLALIRDNDFVSRLGKGRYTVKKGASMSNGLGEGKATVHRWTGPGRDRLEVWLSTDGETNGDGFCALETESGVVLVAGCACGHPYLLCNLFTFGNSDGSSEWLPPPEGALKAGKAGAGDVVEHLYQVAHTYLFEQIH